MSEPILTSQMEIILERFKAKHEAILDWLKAQELKYLPPLYSSVDIRNAGFKAAIVDTNLFPAGFNNVCEHGLEDAVKFMKQAIAKRSACCNNVLIVAEEHTRNTWYLENIRILQDIIQKAGYNAKIATFLSVQPSFCDGARAVELETATGQTVKIHCFKRILEDYQAGKEQFCMIILNNDLTGGIPEILKQAAIPIYPSAAAGWHSRLKSNHFKYTETLMNEFGKLVNLDPWFFTCLYSSVSDLDINIDNDQKRLADTASELFNRILKKYKEHNISSKPYFVVKSDSGTYGMGVMTFEDPKEIIGLNRKKRNDLHVGKGSVEITRYLLQEGVPTIYNIDGQVSEVVIYQIENNLIGGFYRMNDSKTDRENLNSKGMSFKKICPHLEKYGDCNVHPNVSIFDVYRILARIAGLAARFEINQLESAVDAHSLTLNPKH